VQRAAPLLANCNFYQNILRHVTGVRIRHLTLGHHHHDLPAKTLLAEAKTTKRLPDEIRRFAGVANEARIESPTLYSTEVASQFLQNCGRYRACPLSSPVQLCILRLSLMV
jgi:hypothetical protein